MVVLQPIKPGPPRANLLSLKRGRARRALSLLGNNNSQHNLQLAQSLLTITAEEFTNKWNFDPIQGVPLPSGRFQWTPVTSPDPATVTPSEATKAETSCDLEHPSRDDVPHPANDKSKDQKTCVTLTSPSAPDTAGQVSAGRVRDLPMRPPEVDASKAKSASDSHTCCARTCACDKNPGTRPATGETDRTPKGPGTAKAEADSGIDSDDSMADDPESNCPSSIKSDSRQSTRLRQTCITEFVRPQKLSSFKVPEPLTHHSSSYSKKRPASSLQDQLNQPPHKKVLLHLRA